MSVSDLVGEIEGLRARTRRASFGAAVPLALLGLLVAFAAPFYAAAYPVPRSGSGSFSLEDLYGNQTFLTRLLRIEPGGAGQHRLVRYWLLAVPVAFGLVAAYYAWRARRTGISLDGWRVAFAGGAVLLALLLAVELPAHGLPVEYQPNAPRLGNFVNPLLVVAAAAFAVAWVERSRATLAVAVVFLLGVLAFDVRVLANESAGAWDNLQSAGTATLVLAGWLLAASGVLGAAASLRRRA